MVTNKYIYFSLLCSLTVLLPACTDDAESDNRAMMLSRSINFTTGSPQSWNAEGDSVVTRSALFSMNGDNGDELPVRLEVKSGIEAKNLTSAATTRGLAYNNSSASLYSTVGAFTYSYDAAWLYTNYTSFTPFMDNICATEASGIYVPQQKYSWDDVADKLVRTFLYSPHSTAINTETKNYLTTKLSATTKGLPQLVYEIPDDADKQPDLLAVYSIIDDLESALRDNPWAVSFHHILSAVRVKIGSDFPDGIIKSISLRNVYKNGTYTFGCKYNNASTSAEQTKADAWSVSNYAGTVFTQTLDFDAKSQKDVLVISGDKTWMMLPQTLQNNSTYPATLELTFQKDGSSEVNTYKCLLRSFTTSWVMGKTYTYKISDLNDTDYTFEIAALNDYEYTGGSQTMQITSYKTLTNVNTGTETKQAVSWNITQYSTDGTSFSSISNLPAYTALSAVKGNGHATSTNSVTTYMLAATPTYTANPVYTSTTLSSAAEITTWRDLSLYDVMGNAHSRGRNTANCYVVRAAGQYKIPCVYGNAIKDGATNSSAYTSTASADNNTLSTFLNGNNVGITDPWLQNCGATPTSASIVWQDAADLITNVSIGTESNYKYLYFTVPKANIQRGNALLAVKDASGNIQWSWHIWVTDEDFTTNSQQLASQTFKTTPTSQTYTVMSTPLGTVVGATTANFAERDVWIKAVQTESNKEYVVKLHQKGASGVSVNYTGATYYQWGRKDPMPVKDLTGYSGVGRYLGSTVANLPLLYEGIRNPGIFYGGYGSFGSACWFRGLANSQTTSTTDMGNIDNLWSANSKKTDTSNYPTALSNEKVVKTVYDPSPAGWHVPEMGVFSRMNFFNSYSNIYYLTKLNYNPVTNNLEWTNDLKLNNEYITYTFPAVGHRNYVAGAITFNTNHAMCWTAFSYGDGTAVNLNFTARRAVIAYTWIDSGAMSYIVRVEGDDTCCYPLSAGLNVRPVADY